MQATKWAAIFVLAANCLAADRAAAEHGERSWIRSYSQAYRDPANYPGRTIYPGSRYGFSGYYRPVLNTDPYPRSMRKVVPPTMDHWSKSAPQHGPAFSASESGHSVSSDFGYYAE